MQSHKMKESINWSQKYPNIKRQFISANNERFEQAIAYLVTNFSDMVHLDWLEKELSNEKQGAGDYFDFCQQCIYALIGRMPAAWCSGFYGELNNVTEDNGIAKNFINKKMLLVPPQDNKPSKSVDLLGSIASGQELSELSFIDMCRLVGSINTKPSYDWNSNVTDMQRTKKVEKKDEHHKEAAVYKLNGLGDIILHFSNLHHHSLVVDINLNPDKLPKWVVIKLENNQTATIYCKKPLSLQEKDSIQTKLKQGPPASHKLVINFIGPEKDLSTTEYTGYSAIAWLNNEVVHNRDYEFDDTGSFDLRLNQILITYFGRWYSRKEYVCGVDERQNGFSAGFNYVLKTYYKNDLKNLQQMLQDLSGLTGLGSIFGKPIKPGEIAKVMAICAESKINEKQFKDWVDVVKRSSLPHVCNALKEHKTKISTDQILEENDGKLKFTLNSRLSDNPQYEGGAREIIYQNYGKYCEHRDFNPKCFGSLKRKEKEPGWVKYYDSNSRNVQAFNAYMDSLPSPSDLGVGLLLHVIRHSQDMQALTLDFPAELDDRTSLTFTPVEKEFIFNVLSNSCTLTEINIPDDSLWGAKQQHPYLKKIKYQLEPILWRNKWLAENHKSGLPTFNQANHWQVAAWDYLVYLSDHDNISQAEKYKFCKDCVSHMGLKGLQEVMQLLSNETFQDRLKPFFQNKPLTFYLACDSKDENEFNERKSDFSKCLELLNAHLERKDYFPFTQLEIKYSIYAEAGEKSNDLIIDIVDKLNKLSPPCQKIKLDAASSLSFVDLIDRLIAKALRGELVSNIEITGLEGFNNRDLGRELWERYQFLNSVIIDQRSHQLNATPCASAVTNTPSITTNSTQSTTNSSTRLQQARERLYKQIEKNKKTWPISHAIDGSVPLEHQHEQQHQSEKQSQHEWQHQHQQEHSNDTSEIYGDLISYDNIKDNKPLAVFWRNLQKEQQFCTQRVIPLENETFLQALFRNWIGCDPKSKAPYQIHSMTQMAAQKLMQWFPWFESGVCAENLPPGFVIVKHLGTWILDFKPGLVLDAKTDPLTVVPERLPPLVPLAGDFRQFNIEKYKEPVKPEKLLDGKTLADLCLFAALQPPLDDKKLDELVNEFWRINKEALKKLNFSKQEVKTFWPILTQVWTAAVEKYTFVLLDKEQEFPKELTSNVIFFKLNKDKTLSYLTAGMEELGNLEGNWDRCSNLEALNWRKFIILGETTKKGHTCPEKGAQEFKTIIDARKGELFQYIGESIQPKAVAELFFAKLSNQELRTWALDKNFSIETLHALDQVRHQLGMPQLVNFLETLKKLDCAKNIGFFEKFKKQVLEKCPSFISWTNPAAVQAMQQMVMVLGQNEAMANLWLKFCEKQVPGVGIEKIERLWNAFYYSVVQLGKLTGEEFDKVDPTNMLVFMDRLLTIYTKLPASERPRLLQQLRDGEIKKLEHGGIYYAVVYDNFWNISDPQLGLDGAAPYGPRSVGFYRSYCCLDDTQATKLRCVFLRHLASHARFSGIPYKILSTWVTEKLQKINESQLSKDEKHRAGKKLLGQFSWLFYTRYNKEATQENLNSLEVLATEFPQILAAIALLLCRWGRDDSFAKTPKFNFFTLLLLAKALQQDKDFSPNVPDYFFENEKGDFFDALEILLQVHPKQAELLPAFVAAFKQIKQNNPENPNFKFLYKWMKEVLQLSALFGVVDVEKMQRLAIAVEQLPQSVKNIQWPLLVKQLLAIDFTDPNNDLTCLNPENFDTLFNCIITLKGGEDSEKANKEVGQFWLELKKQGLNVTFSSNGEFGVLQAKQLPNLAKFNTTLAQRLRKFLLQHIVVPTTSQDPNPDVQAIIDFFQRMQQNLIDPDLLEGLLIYLEKTPKNRYWAASYFAQLLQAFWPLDAATKEHVPFPLSLWQTLLSQDLLLQAQDIDHLQAQLPPQWQQGIQVIVGACDFTPSQKRDLGKIWLKLVKLESYPTGFFARLITILAKKEYQNVRSLALQILLKSEGKNSMQSYLLIMSDLLGITTEHLFSGEDKPDEGAPERNVKHAIEQKSAQDEEALNLWFNALLQNPQDAKAFYALIKSKEFDGPKQKLLLNVMAFSSLHGDNAKENSELRKRKIEKLIEELSDLKVAIEFLQTLKKRCAEPPHLDTWQVLKLMKRYTKFISENENNGVTQEWLNNNIAHYLPPRPIRHDYKPTSTRKQDLTRILGDLFSTGALTYSELATVKKTFHDLELLQTGALKVKGQSIEKLPQATLLKEYKKLAKKQPLKNLKEIAQYLALQFEIAARTLPKHLYPNLLQQIQRIIKQHYPHKMRATLMFMGQGKSFMLALDAIDQVFREKDVSKEVVVLAPTYLLAQAAQQEFDPLFKAMGLSSGCVNAKISVQDYCIINYITPEEFSLSMDSSKLKLKANTNPKEDKPRKKRIILVDEIDDMLRKGKQTRYLLTVKPSQTELASRTWFYEAVNAFYAVNKEKLKNGIDNEMLKAFDTWLAKAAASDPAKESFLATFIAAIPTLVMWLQSGGTTFGLKKNVHFIVWEGKEAMSDTEAAQMRLIVPLFYNHTMFGAQFANGVQQLVTAKCNQWAKENNEPADYKLGQLSEVLSARQAKEVLKSSLDNGDDIFYYTGTLPPSYAAWLRKLHNSQEQQIVFPLNYSSNQHWDVPTICSSENNEEDKLLSELKALIDNHKKNNKAKQSILICCKDDAEALLLKAKLESNGAWADVKAALKFHTNTSPQSLDEINTEMEEEPKILFASNLGLGVNLTKVDCVVSLGFPSEDANMLAGIEQRIARGGRKGQESHGHLFLTNTEVTEKYRALRLQIEALGGQLTTAKEPPLDPQECLKAVLWMSDYLAVLNTLDEAHAWFVAQFSSWALECLAQITEEETRLEFQAFLMNQQQFLSQLRWNLPSKLQDMPAKVTYIENEVIRVAGSIKEKFADKIEVKIFNSLSYEDYCGFSEAEIANLTTPISDFLLPWEASNNPTDKEELDPKDEAKAKIKAIFLHFMELDPPKAEEDRYFDAIPELLEKLTAQKDKYTDVMEINVDELNSYQAIYTTLEKIANSPVVDNQVVENKVPEKELKKVEQTSADSDPMELQVLKQTLWDTVKKCYKSEEQKEQYEKLWKLIRPLQEKIITPRQLRQMLIYWENLSLYLSTGDVQQTVLPLETFCQVMAFLLQAELLQTEKEQPNPEKLFTELWSKTQTYLSTKQKDKYPQLITTIWEQLAKYSENQQRNKVIISLLQQVLPEPDKDPDPKLWLVALPHLLPLDKAILDKHQKLIKKILKAFKPQGSVKARKIGYEIFAGYLKQPGENNSISYAGLAQIVEQDIKHFSNLLDSNDYQTYQQNLIEILVKLDEKDREPFIKNLHAYIKRLLPEEDKTDAAYLQKANAYLKILKTMPANICFIFLTGLCPDYLNKIEKDETRDIAKAIMQIFYQCGLENDWNIDELKDNIITKINENIQDKSVQKQCKLMFLHMLNNGIFIDRSGQLKWTEGNNQQLFKALLEDNYIKPTQKVLENKKPGDLKLGDKHKLTQLSAELGQIGWPNLLELAPDPNLPEKDKDLKNSLLGTLNRNFFWSLNGREKAIRKNLEQALKNIKNDEYKSNYAKTIAEIQQQKAELLNQQTEANKGRFWFKMDIGPLYKTLGEMQRQVVLSWQKDQPETLLEYNKLLENEFKNLVKEFANSVKGHLSQYGYGGKVSRWRQTLGQWFFDAGDFKDQLDTSKNAKDSLQTQLSGVSKDDFNPDAKWLKLFVDNLSDSRGTLPSHLSVVVTTLITDASALQKQKEFIEQNHTLPEIQVN